METVIAPLDTIRCPNFRHVIPISEMLCQQIAERERAQSKAEIEELRIALAREQREIKEREKKVEVLVEKRVATRVAKIEQDEREKARGSVLLEIKDLKNQSAKILKQRVHPPLPHPRDARRLPSHSSPDEPPALAQVCPISAQGGV